MILVPSLYAYPKQSSRIKQPEHRRFYSSVSVCANERISPLLLFLVSYSIASSSSPYTADRTLVLVGQLLRLKITNLRLALMLLRSPRRRWRQIRRLLHLGKL